MKVQKKQCAKLASTLIRSKRSVVIAIFFLGRQDIEAWFMSAQDIAAALSDGAIDAGITGRDLLEEIRDVGDRTSEQVEIISDLDYGHTDMVVAVPNSWIDVENMRDLNEMAYDFRQRTGRRLRVATKYVNITRRFFAEHGVSDYRIAYSEGATEGAPLTGFANLIVDISSTGSTLRANRLRVLTDGKVLKSNAVLAVSPPNRRDPARDDVLDKILQQLKASA